MFDLIEKFINDHQVFCGGCLAFITSMIRVWRKSNSLIDKVLDNEHLDCKMSIIGHKALIKIESTHYCIAVMSDEDMMKSDE